ERVAAVRVRRRLGRVVSSRKALQLPVVMLARRPPHASLPRNLSAPRELPQVLGIEVATDQLEGLLMRRAGPARRDDDAARQDSRRTAGGIVEALPPFDD